jgi:hypothetical protein
MLEVVVTTGVVVVLTVGAAVVLLVVTGGLVVLVVGAAEVVVLVVTGGLVVVLVVTGGVEVTGGSVVTGGLVVLLLVATGGVEVTGGTWVTGGVVVPVPGTQRGSRLPWSSPCSPWWDLALTLDLDLSATTFLAGVTTGGQVRAFLAWSSSASWWWVAEAVLWTSCTCWVEDPAGLAGAAEKDAHAVAPVAMTVPDATAVATRRRRDFFSGER